MKRTLARFALSGLLAVSAASHAASTTTTDFSDLWWNAAESGWGAQVYLQGDVIFLSLFVYDSQRKPIFYTGSDMRRATTTVPGETVYNGALYRNSGPSFSGPFDPARVTNTAVGTASLRFSSATAGTLSYTVDGVAVSKAITRLTWTGASLAGDYKGGMFVNTSNCLGGTGATTLAYPGSLKVTQVGTSIEINSVFTPGFAQSGSCRLRGTYSQNGRLAAITQGTYNCEFVEGPTPTTGTFDITAIEFGENGFSGVYVAHEGSACVQTGRYGGVRRGYGELPPTVDPPQ
jgi:hypothetical protein